MDNTGEEIVFTKYPMKMSPCDPARDFQRDKTQDYFLKNITYFDCLDTKELYFQGTLVSPHHSFFHFEMLPCNETRL